MTTGNRLRNLEAAEQYLVGNGNPNGAEDAAEGTLYWDYTNDDLYANTDGATAWQIVGGGGGSSGAPKNAQYLTLALNGTLTNERRFVAGDGLQATDGGANADYTLNIDVSDFAGAGLEDDGAENLRIAAAAAGDGLTGGSGAALDVDLSATLDANLLGFTAGELDLDTQAANIVFAGPAAGGAVAPTFRALVSADIPDLSAIYATVGNISGTQDRLAQFDATGAAVVDSNIEDSVTGGVLDVTAALSANRTFTLPDADTSITGGGTLALGGHTLTVPETLTVAGRNVANTFTAAQKVDAPFSATTYAAVGATANSAYRFWVDDQSAVTAGAVYASYNYLHPAPTANSSAAYSALYNRTAIYTNHAYSGIIRAGYFLVDIRADSATDVRGNDINITCNNATNSPDVTTLYGQRITVPATALFNSVTNAYGLYIDVAYPATNPWAIYTAGGGVRFGDDVVIGATTASAQLHVDQSDNDGAQPVLLLDQGDASEEAIKISYDSADVDMRILSLDVTGTPELGWDESEDEFTLSKGLAVTGYVRGSTGLFTAQDVSNFSDPPTDAELDAAFGTPATLGRGFVATLDDNDADTDCYLVWTSDASWYYVKGTKAA